MFEKKGTGKPRKISVLGGGISALSAVEQLTRHPGWKEKYEITLYQMGWRLGGKGASGRNPEIADRIEEHGLHVWFGCYDNAWDLLRSCYQENNRPLGQPLSTIEEAFEPASTFTEMEEINGEWVAWPIVFPSNEGKPGDGKSVPGIWDYIARLVRRMMEGVIMGHVSNAFGQLELSPWEQRFVRRLNDSFLTHFAQYFKYSGFKVNETSIYDFVDRIEEFLDQTREKQDFTLLIFGLEEGRKWLWGEVKDHIESSHNIRRVWLFFDFLSANILGMIREGVIYEGFDVLNKYDYREFVAKYSFTPATTADSCIVQAFYSVIFSGYLQDTFEAGTALKGALRISFTYHGAYFYRMNAGMGDVVFTPIYEVLRERGVKFKFFHKVEELTLSPDGKSIGGIRLNRQVTLRNGEYQPLYAVKGLPSWPSRPLWDQIVESPELQERGVNLESDWSDWKGVEQISLEKGKDFDEVILGIPVAALRKLTPQLALVSERWADMLQGITTTPTQAFQVWLKPDIYGLGWPERRYGKPLTGTFAQPLDTNADLSNLILRENWPAGQQPGHIAYLCGKFNFPEGNPESHPHHPEMALEKVRQNARKYLAAGAFRFWPKAALENGRFNHDLLVDLKERKGEERLESQYIRANIDASEQYTLSEVGNSRFRLKPGDSGFENLYLTGDWTDTGFNVGCIEASVMSGRMAARALSGDWFPIVGEAYETLKRKAGKHKLAAYSSRQVRTAFLAFYKSFLA